MKKVQCLGALMLFMAVLPACQTQQVYAPYFVYENRLNQATCPAEALDTICKISRKSTECIFFRDFVYCYYKNILTDKADFVTQYSNKVGNPGDYTVEIRYNLFGIPIFTGFKWSPPDFNYELDILTRQ